MKTKTTHHPAAGRYQKVVTWSDEDQCFIGRCPGLFLCGCHGDDEATVYAELCGVVDEHLRILDGDAAPLPPATARDYSGTMSLRLGRDLHQAVAARSMATRRSINDVVVDAVRRELSGRI